jgi:hypothetical protein
MTGLFIVMAESTWLLQVLGLIYFLFLHLRCVQVFVTLILFIVVISISLFGSFYNINVRNLLSVNDGLFQTLFFVFGPRALSHIITT